MDEEEDVEFFDATEQIDRSLEIPGVRKRVAEIRKQMQDADDVYRLARADGFTDEAAMQLVESVWQMRNGEGERIR